MSLRTDPIFADVETIPAQDPRIIEYLKSGIEQELGEKVAAIRSAEIKVPKNYTKQESIDAYIADKKASIEADVKDAIDAATAKFDETWRKTSFDGGFGQVVSCSLASGDDYPIGLYGKDWRSADYEVRLLQRINETVEQMCGRAQGQQLIGHNISFDRRFLRQRGIIRQVRMHPMFTREVKPWDSDLVYDTMTGWTGDMRDRVSMERLCVAMGIDTKGTELDPEDADFDGSKVWDYVRDGKIAKVSRYCDYDVIRCRAFWHRLNYRMPPAIVEPDAA